MTIIQFTSISTGGAGVEVMNMHRDLIHLGHDSYVINRGKYILDKCNKKIPLKGVSLYIGKFFRLINRLILNKIHIDNMYAPYNLYERFLCYNVHKILQQIPQKPDIIFIKWASNFSNAQFIARLKQKTAAKIVISLIDQAPLTGGCHYPNNCQQYTKGCMDCPMSSAIYLKHCIRRNFKYKQHYLPKDVLVWVGSTGDEELVRNSLLFKNHKVIKNLLTVDADLFLPVSKSIAKSLWGIDSTKKVILCGSSNIKESRKGMNYLVKALKEVKNKNFILFLIGNETLPDIECEHIHVGYLTQEKLISAYQAADVFVCPSIADSGPLMINQSIMVGTPVVSFPIGVSKDIVHTMETGYLAALCDSKDLANGIDLILNLSDEEYEEVSNNCRKFALNHYGTHNSKSCLNLFLERIMHS